MNDKRSRGGHKQNKSERLKEATRKVYYDEALGHLKSNNYQKALAAFNTALELSPNDKTALVARSKCHLLLGDANEALKDAEYALSIDKSFIKALFQKAEALYHLGDFEHSLMYYHQGLKIRPEMGAFRLGVQKAQEAIENVIGNNKCPFPTSPRRITELVIESQKLNENKTILTKPAPAVVPMQKKELKRGMTMAKQNERQLLGSLYTDKQYLEQLLQNPDIISLNQDFANNDVAEHAKEGIEFLKSRQEFWRQQKPNAIKNLNNKGKSKKQMIDF